MRRQKEGTREDRGVSLHEVGGVCSVGSAPISGAREARRPGPCCLSSSSGHLFNFCLSCHSSLPTLPLSPLSPPTVWLLRPAGLFQLSSIYCPSPPTGTLLFFKYLIFKNLLMGGQEGETPIGLVISGGRLF